MFNLVFKPALISKFRQKARNISTSFYKSQSNSIESHRVFVNDVNFHYDKTGSGDHNVLLLPGMYGSTRLDFEPQLQGLNKDLFTIYALDQRGYGKSSPPVRDWPLDHFHRDAYDAVAVMKKLGVPRYSVVGWSDGGTSAMIMAAKFPQAISGLVLWGTKTYVGKKDLNLLRYMQDIEHWGKEQRSKIFAFFTEEFIKANFVEHLATYEKRHKVSNGDICTDVLKDVQCPTMIFYGGKDPIQPTHEHVDHLQKHIKNTSFYEFPDGYHHLHLQFAEEFNTRVEEFLLKLS